MRDTAVVPRIPVSGPPLRKYSVVRDLYWGTVLGDFAPAIGIPGALIQAVLGYVPVLGTITALRDATAGFWRHDDVGIVLNCLALFPVLGGLAKTADVLHGLRGLHGLHRAYTSSQQPGEMTAGQTRRGGFGCLGLAVSVIVLACGLVFSAGIHAVSLSDKRMAARRQYHVRRQRCTDSYPWPSHAWTQHWRSHLCRKSGLARGDLPAGSDIHWLAAGATAPAFGVE